MQKKYAETREKCGMRKITIRIDFPHFTHLLLLLRYHCLLLFQCRYCSLGKTVTYRPTHGSGTRDIYYVDPVGQIYYTARSAIHISFIAC